MAPYKGGQRSAAQSRRKPKQPNKPKVSSDKRTNLPGGKTKKNSKLSNKSQRQGPPMPPRLAKAPPAPKLPPPAQPIVFQTKASRPPAKPKAPAKAKPIITNKPKVAQTSGIGPLKSGEAYARRKQSISETIRQLREMRKRSEDRQKTKK